MGGQYYKIKYGSMDQFYSIVSTAIMDWNTNINDLSTGFTGIIEMESLQSASAQAMKDYLQEVHGVLLYSIQQVLSVFQADLLKYKYGYYEIESDIYATIPEEVLNNVCEKLGNEMAALNSISESIGNSIGSVSDIIQIANPGKECLHTMLSEMKRDVLLFKNSVDRYENDQDTYYKNDLQDALDALQLVINDYKYNRDGMAGYQAGAISQNPKMLDLYQKVQKCAERMQEDREAIEAAAQKQTEVYAQMQADYEAACEARKDEGVANMITGGIVMIAGGAAIVLTAGMATPIVATVAVTGTCTMAYGASNMVEGAQDVYYASIGDLDSAAINPIRDTVFAGNQKLYDAWGSLNMTVASLCVPTGQAVNGMAGASTRMMTQTAIKVAGKELVKDQIFDFASGEITAYMADRFALNQTQSALLELAVSTTMDKGSDLLGDKISGSKGDPFTDRMSFEDAKRYNAHWKDVEAGTHNNHPGLSSEDIAAWDFADRKVNDHITINKMDVNEVINLRMAENAKQNAFLNESVKTPEAESVGIGASTTKSINWLDEMSPEDAKRYAVYQSEVEAGTHNNHPGLSNEDIAAWEFADRKVNDHIAINKVDVNEVINLRMAENAKQNAFLSESVKIEGGESGSISLIDIDEIRPKLKTEPDTAFFWSGRTDGIGGADNAANIAKSRGGVTLESTIASQNITMPEWDFNNPSTMEAWDLASGAYAEQVSGEIRAVIGAELRTGNIWENVELPRLMKNPNVTKITTIDPKTGVEKIIFER